MRSRNSSILFAFTVVEYIITVGTYWNIIIYLSLCEK